MGRTQPNNDLQPPKMAFNEVSKNNNNCTSQVTKKYRKTSIIYLLGLCFYVKNHQLWVPGYGTKTHICRLIFWAEHNLIMVFNCRKWRLMKYLKTILIAPCKLPENAYKNSIYNTRLSVLVFNSKTTYIVFLTVVLKCEVKSSYFQ